MADDTGNYPPEQTVILYSTIQSIFRSFSKREIYQLIAMIILLIIDILLVIFLLKNNDERYALPLNIALLLVSLALLPLLLTTRRSIREKSLSVKFRPNSQKPLKIKNNSPLSANVNEIVNKWKKQLNSDFNMSNNVKLEKDKQMTTEIREKHPELSKEDLDQLISEYNDKSREEFKRKGDLHISESKEEFTW